MLPSNYKTKTDAKTNEFKWLHASLKLLFMSRKKKRMLLVKRRLTITKKKSNILFQTFFLFTLNKRYHLLIVGSLSNDNGDGNENVTNLHIKLAKTIALHALYILHLHFSVTEHKAQ